jgi:osmotically-inducible protein OsmY
MNLSLPTLLKLSLTAALSTAALTALSGCASTDLNSSSPPASNVLTGDRRTTGTYVEDEAIEWRTVGALNQHLNAKSEKWHINPTSYNRRVLLTGEAENEELKQLAERVARSVKEVKDVVNEIQVRPESTVLRRGNDSAISGAVKSRFFGNNQFSPTHVKVLTEANVVYLMGIVTQAEADAAVEIARTTRGVSKVVRVFEYVTK